jgi:CBS domain-containing protein
MHTVATILEEKGSRVVHSVKPHATVFEAVEKMASVKIGAVLVCDEGRPVGIFSERDLLTRVILERRDPASTRVGDVMSAEIACVDLGTPTEEAMAIMTERRCRHLPVVDAESLVGLVSIGDLVRHTSQDQEFEIRMLTHYIHGKYPG